MATRPVRHGGEMGEYTPERRISAEEFGHSREYQVIS
ncbi:hypothetical protein SAMN05444959_10750 [Paracoccus seriniphilus]|uniref:Uncharacterized protein n=1 Tax=Paracoccus seriniphilus TaxID=184748 RepID=A0A239PWM6_9RHOB|nr:hypothetical protein SAMN05444959_10750 [Paracoccus seriniphilus]